MVLRMTAREAFALRAVNGIAAPSKYGNTKVEHAGRKFDSKAEYRRYLVLEALQNAGDISELECQVPYLLIPKQKRPTGGHERACTYVADFVYRDKAGIKVVEDSKGMLTDVYKLKRKLMLMVHGVEVLETKT